MASTLVGKLEAECPNRGAAGPAG